MNDRIAAGRRFPSKELCTVSRIIYIIILYYFMILLLLLFNMGTKCHFIFPIVFKLLKA